MVGVVQAMLPFLGDGMGEPYLGDGAASGTDIDGDVGDVSRDGAAGVAVADCGVGVAAGICVGENVACDAPGVSAAGDAMLGTLSLMVRVLQWMLRLTVRVLQVIVLVVGPRRGGRRPFWAGALANPGGGPGGRWWLVGSAILAVLVASGVRAGPRQSWWWVV